MASHSAGPLLPLRFLARTRTRELLGNTIPSSTPHYPPAHVGLSSVFVSGIMSSAPQTLELVRACSPTCSLAPPKQASITSRAVVPEKCIALPRKARRRRRGGHGGSDEGDGFGDDGSGGGDSGGDGGWEDDGGGEDEEDAKRFAMWTALCICGVIHSVYFLLFGNREKAQGPLVATITSSLCARCVERSSLMWNYCPFPGAVQYFVGRQMPGAAIHLVHIACPSSVRSISDVWFIVWGIGKWVWKPLKMHLCLVVCCAFFALFLSCVGTIIDPCLGSSIMQAWAPLSDAHGRMQRRRNTVKCTKNAHGVQLCFASSKQFKRMQCLSVKLLNYRQEKGKGKEQMGK